MDPDYAATFHPNNTRRLSRALEILEATGKPPSQIQGWRKGSDGYRESPGVTIEGLGAVTFELVGIERPREELYRRINDRVTAMIDYGWLPEARGLLAAGIAPQTQPMQGVGYLELAQVVQGELKLDEAIPLIQQRTRQFARRQITWFKREPVRWIEADGSADSD